MNVQSIVGRVLNIGIAIVLCCVPLVVVVAMQQQLAAQQQIATQQTAIVSLEQANAKARLAAQEQPKLTFAGIRPTISSFDSRSSIALRAVVQLDAAQYRAPRPFVPFDGQGGRGAWELALRYSRTDLDSHSGAAGAAPPAEGVRGGVQSITTAGVNWYPNANLRFMLDVLHVNVKRLNPAGMGATPFGAAPSTPPLGSQIGQNFNAFALRSQYSF